MLPEDRLLEVLLRGPLHLTSLSRPGNPTVPGTEGMLQSEVIEASRELAAANLMASSPLPMGGVTWTVVGS